MLGLLIYAAWALIYVMAIGAVGMVIEICETLREGWSGEGEDEQGMSTMVDAPRDDMIR